MVTRVRNNEHLTIFTSVNRRRVGALLLDTIVLNVVFWWVNLIFGIEYVTSGNIWGGTPGSFNFTNYTSQTTVGWPWLMLITFLYFAVQEALFGTTLGKRLEGLRVVGLDGGRLTFRQALLRNLLRLVDALPFFYLVGAVVAIRSPLRQRLGDYAAGTMVVAAQSVPGTALTPMQARYRGVGLGIVVILLLAGSLLFSYFGRSGLEIESLQNTHQFPFEKPYSSYSIGTATTNGDIRTYPVEIQLTDRSTPCHATVILHWRGLLDGWEDKGGQRDC